MLGRSVKADTGVWFGNGDCIIPRVLVDDLFWESIRSVLYDKPIGDHNLLRNEGLIRSTFSIKTLTAQNFLIGFRTRQAMSLQIQVPSPVGGWLAVP